MQQHRMLKLNESLSRGFFLFFFLNTRNNIEVVMLCITRYKLSNYPSITRKRLRKTDYQFDLNCRSQINQMRKWYNEQRENSVTLFIPTLYPLLSQRCDQTSRVNVMYEEGLKQIVSFLGSQCLFECSESPALTAIFPITSHILDIASIASCSFPN